MTKTSGGGKLVYVKQGIIVKQLEKFETKLAETICIELIFSKRNWSILFAYKPRKPKLNCSYHLQYTKESSMSLFN